jgi:hypothetical protein
MDAQFSEIFEQVKAAMKAYEPPFRARKDSDKGYELWTGKEIFLAGKAREEIMFAAVLIQKNFVGFHFFPIYCLPELKEKLHPDLVKKLKGKTCFHLKKPDTQLYQQIADALKMGATAYEKLKWV